jgi:hypothetical protein
MSDPRQKQPQTRTTQVSDEERRRHEEALDQTLADSFPSSDPPSTIPDPESEDEAA